LTSKPVQILLPVTNGGTGNATLTDGNILVGSGTDPIKARVLASADTSIQIIQTADSIILKSKFTAEEVTSDPGCHTQCYRRSGKFGYECECQGVCCSLRSPSWYKTGIQKGFDKSQILFCFQKDKMHHFRARNIDYIDVKKAVVSNMS
jgi:hypothetical protein